MNTELLKNIFKSEVDYLEIQKRVEDLESGYLSVKNKKVLADYKLKLAHDEGTIAIWKSQLDVDFTSPEIHQLREDTLLEYTKTLEESIDILNQSEPSDNQGKTDIQEQIQEVAQTKDFQDSLVAELIVEGGVL